MFLFGDCLINVYNNSLLRSKIGYETFACSNPLHSYKVNYSNFVNNIIWYFSSRAIVLRDKLSSKCFYCPKELAGGCLVSHLETPRLSWNPMGFGGRNSVGSHAPWHLL